MPDIHELNAALRGLADRARRQASEAGHLVRAARSLAAAGRFGDAVDLYGEAVELHPGNAAVQRDFADALRRANRPEDAFERLVEALRLAPDAVETHQRIGELLAAGNGDEGGYLDRVWPEHAPSFALERADQAPPRERGHFLAARQAFAAAAEAYREAVLAGDQNAAGCIPDALRLAGRAGAAALEEGARLLEEGDTLGALRAYRAARAAGDTRVEVYEGLARALSVLYRFGKATAVCRDGLRLHPHTLSLEQYWLWALLREGRTEEAIMRADGFARHHKHGFFDRVQQLSLPVLYRSTDEVENVRIAYRAGLDALDAAVRLRTRAEVERWTGLLRSTNFFLAYQGEDDRMLQERYGRIAQRITSPLLPERPRAPYRPPTGRKLRIGYASPFLNEHTVGKLFLGWLTERDPDRTEVFAYQIGGRSDSLTNIARAHADVFRRLPMAATEQHVDAATQIIDDDLDVLVYPSVGMHPAPFVLASRRLAPVQAVAWGHPVTTGLDTVDYFISSDLMEPEGAEAHYTERLVRLPGIGVCVSRAKAPGQHARAHFGLSESDVLFHSPQSLSKYHPRYDALYPAIASRVPSAVFTFIEDKSATVTRQFVSRMERAFQAAGLDPTLHLAFLPRLPVEEFLDLCRLADVYLDTPGWSGGMTSLEALATGLPTVTWPGPFMRGRHTYAFLRALGLPQLVADDLGGYVEIAVRLGNDAEERASLRHTILERADRLYRDARPVRALEEFYERAVAEA